MFPAGTKPLPEPMLTSHYWGYVAFKWEQFQYYEFENYTFKIGAKYPGANDLKTDEIAN